jgi:phosphoribosylanthranilate isomerase
MSLESMFPSEKVPPHVKICGLTRVEDAVLALELGASFLGLILTKKSPRHLPLEKALELVGEVRRQFGDEIRFVGVYVKESTEEISRADDQLGLFGLQVHGCLDDLKKHFPSERLFPATGIRNEEDAERLTALGREHPACVADAFSAHQAGGTGKVFDHRFVQPFFSRCKVFLAGGLSPDNIEEVVEKLAPGPFPYALDLSSGVEAEPGVKSHEKMRLFFERYTSAFKGLDVY